MKPALVGAIIGSALGLYLSMLYFYSAWLPLTAICILICGLIGLAFKQPFRPSAISALGCLLAYLSYFWIWPELASRAASSPEAHFRAGELMKTRAQFYPDWPRALNHFTAAADADYPPALCAIAEFHHIGYMGVKKDVNLSIAIYQRAADLGDTGAQRAVDNLTAKANKLGEQGVVPNP